MQAPSIVSYLLLLLTTLTAAVPAAQLTGWTELPTTPVDLTGEGTLDWAHWGFGGDRLMNHRTDSTVGLISSLTNVKNGVYGNEASGIAYMWKDGTPTVACVGSNSGVRIVDVGNGASFTVPADPTIRTVRLYLSGHHAVASVRAHLSDSSAPDWQDGSWFPQGDDFTAVYVMTYASTKPGQTLTVTMLDKSRLGDWDSIIVHAVTVCAGSVKPAAVLPAAPIMTAIPGDGRVALQWTRLQGIATYNLYRSATDSPGVPWRSGVSPTTSDITPSQEKLLIDAADTAATNGTAWHYWVSAVNQAGEGPRSTVVTAAPARGNVATPLKKRHISLLPLGDSITFGIPDPHGGYRPVLISGLTKAGYLSTMVGSFTDNSLGMAAPCHEGWPGRTIEQLRDGVVDRAVGIYQPDVILLMIGTNNLAWGDKKQEDVDHALTSYDSLLDRILAAAPKARLIVSPILPLSGANSDKGAKQPLVDAFNHALHAKVESRAKNGQLISWATQMSAITVDQLGDGVHPTVDAYSVMANAWLESIKALDAPHEAPVAH